MNSATLTGATAFAADAPLAFWTATIATGVALALALGRGPRRWAGFTAVISAASVIAAPAWGWLVDVGLAAGLLLIAQIWPRFARRRQPSARGRARRTGRDAHARLADAQRDARLLGRTARIASGSSAVAEVRLRLDGARWRARVDGPAVGAQTLVRVMRIASDGRLVVRAAA